MAADSIYAKLGLAGADVSFHVRAHWTVAASLAGDVGHHTKGAPGRVLEADWRRPGGSRVATVGAFPTVGLWQWPEKPRVRRALTVATL